MDDLGFYILLNSIISVISGWWEGDNETNGTCQAGLETGTTRSAGQHLTHWATGATPALQKYSDQHQYLVGHYFKFLISWVSIDWNWPYKNMLFYWHLQHLRSSLVWICSVCLGLSLPMQQKVYPSSTKNDKLYLQRCRSRWGGSLQGHLICIYTVCPLVFQFSTGYSMDKLFLKFCRCKFCCLLFGALKIKGILNYAMVSYNTPFKLIIMDNSQ